MPNTSTATATPPDAPDTPAPSPKLYGLKEAAREAGVSTATVRRRRELLLEGGATAAPEGWAIPVEALVYAGLMVDSVTPTDAGDTTAEGGATSTPSVTGMEPEVSALRAELAVAVARADLFEAVAKERADALEDARLYLRALTGPSSAPAATPTTAPVPVAPAPATAPPAAEQTNLGTLAQPDVPDPQRGRLGSWWARRRR